MFLYECYTSYMFILTLYLPFSIDPIGHKKEIRRAIKKNEFGVGEINERNVNFIKENDKIIFF